MHKKELEDAGVPPVRVPPGISSWLKGLDVLNIECCQGQSPHSCQYSVQQALVDENIGSR